MSLHDSESCSASLDSGPHSPRRSRTDSFRRPYTRSPLSAAENNVPTRPRASSRASSLGHESRYSVRSFQALPPILSGSSVHLRSNLFQSFMISSELSRSRRPSRLSEMPPALPPLPSLSQPLFPPVAEAQNDLFQLPSLRHPNSPYVPWDSPMRRQIFRPLTPESSSPEPAEIPEELPDRKRKLTKMSRGIVKRVAGAAKRIFTRQRHLVEPSSVPPHLSISTHIAPDNSLLPPAYPPSPGVASFDSSNTRSLALWLDARRQEALEWETDSCHFLTLEDYERRGSWINQAGGKAFVCSNPSCTIHSRLSNGVVSILEVDVDVEHRDSHDSEETAVSDNVVDIKTQNTP